MNIVPGWLKQAWNAHQEKLRLKAHHKEQRSALTQAIADKNPAQIGEVLAATEKADVLISHQYRSLLREAIKTNDVATFDSVHNLSGAASPNYTFYDFSPLVPEGPHHSSRTPLLSAAIDQGADAIALHLAQNPQTDIQAQASSTTSTYHSGGMFGSGNTEHKTKVDPIPRLLAEKKGMNEVAAVLAQREAADLTAKAAQLARKP